MPEAPRTAALALAGLLALAAGAHAAGEAPAPDAGAGEARGSFAYTIEPLGPLTQSYPVLDFLGPYYYFLLTNVSAQTDSFRLEVQNNTQPTWFPQVCLRAICFPDSTTLEFEAGESDTVGVNIVPFSDGVGEADFVVTSLGDPSLQSVYHVVLYAGSAAVDVEELAGGAAGLSLGQSRPNPVRAGTLIPFTLPRGAEVSLGVFDLAGRRVATLADGDFPAGAHSVRWTPAPGVPAGVYYYRLEAGAESVSRRLVLLR